MLDLQSWIFPVSGALLLFLVLVLAFELSELRRWTYLEHKHNALDLTIMHMIHSGIITKIERILLDDWQTGFVIEVLDGHERKLSLKGNDLPILFEAVFIWQRDGHETLQDAAIYLQKSYNSEAAGVMYREDRQTGKKAQATHAN